MRMNFDVFLNFIKVIKDTRLLVYLKIYIYNYPSNYSKSEKDMILNAEDKRKRFDAAHKIIRWELAHPKNKYIGANLLTTEDK